MYAVVRRYRTDSVADLFGRVTPELADSIPDQVGALLYAAVDIGDGDAMTVMLFPDESTALAAGAVAAGMEKRMGSAMRLEVGEVNRGPVVVGRARVGVLEPTKV
ncbi:hypothetical protein GCM10023321_69730 [Pseudonocardia eucalypti]|uniref:Uncharacterized protein n=1 Tax=Pseudonocardia eucalypti TaxID=648755 RepID=A0ABP9R4I0_9PSEU